MMSILMNGFIGQGHQVRVVYTSRLCEPPIYNVDPNVEQVYLFASSRYSSESLLNKLYCRLYKFYAIRKQAKLYRPDIVISFIKTQNNDVLASLIGLGIPVVIGDHTNVDRIYPLKTSFLSKVLYPSAAAITMLTVRDYNRWKTKYKSVYYIPNPCDIELNTNVPRKKVILAVGRVNQWQIKGFDSLIIAWHQIKDKYPDWTCQIAGEHSDLSLTALRNCVGEDAYSSVNFIGFRSDIHEYMQACEVFCLSSRVEGMPMVLLEAMNLGCACVAFDCATGPAEIIADGETGLLVDNQNIDDLVKKLELVISDEKLRASFQQKAPASVKKFSTDNVMKMWDGMFHDIKVKYRIN